MRKYYYPSFQNPIHLLIYLLPRTPLTGGLPPPTLTYRHTATRWPSCPEHLLTTQCEKLQNMSKSKFEHGKTFTQLSKPLFYLVSYTLMAGQYCKLAMLPFTQPNLSISAMYGQVLKTRQTHTLLSYSAFKVFTLLCTLVPYITTLLSLNSLAMTTHRSFEHGKQQMCVQGHTRQGTLTWWPFQTPSPCLQYHVTKWYNWQAEPILEEKFNWNIRRQLIYIL